MIYLQNCPFIILHVTFIFQCPMVQVLKRNSTTCKANHHRYADLKFCLMISDCVIFFVIFRADTALPL